MEAKALSFTFLANEGQVKVPFFQRPYIWTMTNWSDLLEELLNTEKNHFLGSVIIKQQPKRTGAPSIALIIDGQQRLTTLSLLVKALYESFDEETKSNARSLTNEVLYYKALATDRDFSAKIEHSRIDRHSYNQIMFNRLSYEELDQVTVEDPASKKTSTDNRILQCYQYFRTQLNDLSIETRMNLFNWLLDKNNKILVVIDLQDTENEQSIFDTINSAGVRLSASDIIKNALFQKALDLKKAEHKSNPAFSERCVEELYLNTWDSVFLSDEETSMYWETLRSTGRILRDNHEILLHSVAVIKGFYDPAKHTFSDLANCYKDYICDLNYQSLEIFATELKQYATLYREKILMIDASTLYTFDDFEKRLFHILDSCDVTTFHPYILSLYYDHDDDYEKLRNEFKKIESLVLYRAIEKKETRSYNKMSKEFISDRSKIDEYLAEITPERVADNLYNISNRFGSMLLFWIELNRRKRDSNKADFIELKYNYSLEHIMPQKWEQHWRNIPIVHGETGLGYGFDIEPDLYRKRMINSLGNMTLLKSGLNSSIKNASLETKIRGQGRMNGMAHYADLWITRKDLIDLFDSGSLIWNESEIFRRTASLAKEIREIWTWQVDESVPEA